MNKKLKNKGYAATLSSALILSLVAIFVRHLTQAYHIPALVLAFWREVIVAGGLGVFFFLANKKRFLIAKRHIGYLVIYGFALAIFNALWTLSVSLNGASVSTVLAYSSTAFSVLLGRFFLKEPITTRKFVAVVLSMAGCALIVNVFDPTVWQLNMVGIISGTSSGLFYALYGIMGRSASERGLNTWTTLMYTFGFASCFMLLFNLLSFGCIPGAAAVPGDLFWLGDDWSGWAVLLGLALGPTLMGYGMYNVGLRYLPSSIANLIATIEPVFTAIIAYFLFGERMSGLQIVGAILILATVVVLRLGKKEI